MYNVSPTYRTKITETTRSTRLRGQIVLGAVTIPLAGEDILAGSVDWKNQCIDKDDFNLGSVFAATLKFSIYDRVTALDLKGATVTLEFGLQLSDILIEYVPLGVFNVIDAGHKLSTIVITAMDNMIRLDKDIPAPLTGTPDALLAAMATATGVDIENTTVASFPNGTDVITITPGDSLITWRDMLMWLSQYLGAFATMSRTGKAWIKELVSTPVMTIAPAIRFKSPLIKDEPVTITGLKATFSSTLYDFNLVITPNTGKTYTLDDNPLFWEYDDTQSGYRLENILTTLGTVNYMQGDVEYNGNPALDVGDYVLLTGTSKGDVVLRITSFSWKSKGKCTIRSAGLSSILKAKEDLSYRKSSAKAQVQIDKVKGLIELKVSQEDLDAQLEDYSTLTQTANSISAAVSTKENMIYKQIIAPAHLDGRLWCDTSTVPNVWKRSNGSAWIKLTPTQASEVGAYSATDGSSLASRVSTAETKITPEAITSTVRTSLEYANDLLAKETAFYKQSTAPFNSIVVNGDFANGTTGWGHYSTRSVESIVSGWLRSTWNIASIVFGTISSWNIPTANKIYVRFVSRASEATNIVVYGNQTGIGGAVTSNQLAFDIGVVESMFSGILTSTGVANNLTFQCNGLNASGKYIELQYAIVINLTAVYGTGNEPTKAQMDEYVKRIWFDTVSSVAKSFSASGWKGSVPYSELTNYSTITQTANAIAIEVGKKEDALYKQQTSPFSNKVLNGDFITDLSNWTALYGTCIWEAGRMKAYGAVSTLRYQPITFTSGRKYYISFDTEIMRYVAGSVGIRFNADAAGGSTVWQINSATTLGSHRTSNVFTMPGTSLSIYAGNMDTANVDSYLDNIIIIDLTATYGAGSEPTVAEMDAIIKRLWLDTSNNTYKSFGAGGWMPSSQLSGAKYVFDGTNAIFTGGGLVIKNNAGTTVFTADTNGDLEITGKITATSGKIGRLDINSNNDIYYLSDLFAKQYDNSDVTRLRQILAGIITATAYDNYVYDINNSGGALTTTDLVQLKAVVAGTQGNPNKMIRSIITIGKATGEITVSSVSTGGYVGYSFTMQADKISGKMANMDCASINNLTLNGLEVYSDAGTLKVR